MYSVVLMAAMMTAPETPQLGHRNSGCCGQAASCGCCGQVASCGCCGESHGRKSRHHAGGGCCGQTSCGCCGQMSCCAPAPSCGCCGGMAAPAAPSMPTPASGPAKTMANPNAATIVVSGAKDAKVIIGGLVSASNSDTRVLVSPSLDAGQVYHYDVTAEVVRDGQTVRTTQTVDVRAGETSELKLDFTAGAVAMK
jgi:uncharacterized protein (TIGR03000 family)